MFTFWCDGYPIMYFNFYLYDPTYYSSPLISSFDWILSYYFQLAAKRWIASNCPGSTSKQAWLRATKFIDWFIHQRIGNQQAAAAAATPPQQITSPIDLKSIQQSWDLETQ